jgi:retron-type reverse transcriptase
MTSENLQVNYEAVYRAWLAFRKGKQPTAPIDRFAYNLEADLERLSDDLSRDAYRHGGYQQIILHEKKRRDLAVAGVRDRVVHRLLYDYLLPIFDPVFDPDVWSCRHGKGLHKCVARTQTLLRTYPLSYVWRADITKFFDSVNQRLLVDCLGRRIGDDKVAMRLCREVIDSYHVRPGCGIPIGNLTSQLFANIYLHEFDRYVRHRLKPQAYVRYGDDFILFYVTCRRTRLASTEAMAFLAEQMNLIVNPKNDIVIAVRQGLKFLGHTVTADSAQVDIYTTRRVLQRVNWHNASSYRALPLVKTAKDGLDWILLNELDILFHN